MSSIAKSFKEQNFTYSPHQLDPINMISTEARKEVLRREVGNKNGSK